MNEDLLKDALFLLKIANRCSHLVMWQNACSNVLSRANWSGALSSDGTIGELKILREIANKDA
jgi:hypothetical protein